LNIPHNVDFRDYITIIGEAEAQEIHHAGYWREQIHERAKNLELSGDLLPWSKVSQHFKIRAAEITLWAGMNGHKKSMVLGQVALSLMCQGKKIAIASLEMKPEETLWRMCQQAAGLTAGQPSHEFINTFMDLANEYLVIYDQLDSVKTEKILGFVNYCGQVLDCDHIMIDSLAKCGIGVENLNTHIHLVSHVRKPQSAGEEYIPTKFDVKGSSALVDLVDNLVICWANKKRESLKQLGQLDEKEQEYFDKTFDQLLIIAKQRHGRWEGKVGLYHHQSLQFVSREGKAMDYKIDQVFDNEEENTEEKIIQQIEF
jgi:twinkle protein